MCGAPGVSYPDGTMWRVAGVLTAYPPALT